MKLEDDGLHPVLSLPRHAMELAAIRLHLPCLWDLSAMKLKHG